MDELLTTKELSKRIKMAPGTIRNLVSQKVLKKNIHYFKPTARKILFHWPAIEDWLRNGQKPSIINQVKSYINVQ